MSGELGTLWGLDYEEFVHLVTDRAQVREHDWVLDLATGTARIPRAIAANGTAPGRVLGLDITMAMLRAGRRAVAAEPLRADVDLVCGSGMQMPFRDDVFDLITCGLGMHHMQVPTTLAQLWRKLKPHGRLLVVAVGAPRLWRWPPVTGLLRLFTFMYFWLKDKKPRAWAESEAFSSVFSPSSGTLTCKRRVLRIFRSKLCWSGVAPGTPMPS